MNAIRILNLDFERIGEIDIYSSFSIVRRWNRPGSFTLKLNVDSPYVDQLIKDNIVVVGGSLRKAGLILYKQFEEGDEEILTVKGVTLDGIVKRRLVIPESGHTNLEFNGNAESVMKHFIDKTLVNTSDPRRSFPNVSIADGHNRGINIIGERRWDNLSNVLEDFSNLSKLGYEASLDYENQNIVFEVYEGTDRSAGQVDVPPVILSPDFESIMEQSYIESFLDYANVAYVGGEGEKQDRRVVIVGEDEGFDRFETFVDARVSEEDDEGNPKSNEVIIEEITQAGREILEELATQLSYEGRLADQQTFVYERDFYLGDIVTLRNKSWGVTLNTRITEVTEIYEREGQKVNLQFGTNKLNITSKIRRSLRQVSGEVFR
ncbi:siphovirus ReqiPepy6 Gp37-like family protein [Paenalkalicoccus suaedae]|uniref:Siphovirus ReqiPepy6 Gp37-like family protein n=1 Tax=Paenalkalicoccus suaedae TaxID=2592382 RepID=A0A859FEW8_9BACI|nr:siphovirus ReqiPepy6 Gp37-like family protein [Paenalkalicoccus suaedae]QKS71893.1 siphovirus ReqiPepy6 Gp37-like family protein [Paenalkalicoccus suaedae]